MPAATAAPARHRANTRARGCAAASGSLTDASSPGELGPERHRALQLGDPARADDRAGRARRRRPPRRAAADHNPPPRRSLPARRTGRRS